LNKRVLVVFLLMLFIVAPLGVAFYGYNNFSKAITPQRDPITTKIVGVPFRGKTYQVILESYITGDPTLDINITLRKPYKRATIIVGDISFKECKGSEACVWRIRTVAELGATVGAVFGVKYYVEDVIKSGTNETAAYKAAEETSKRIESRYLAFVPKVTIGLGLVGNKDHLLIILKGPREGAQKDRIYCPKEGVLVIEATSEDTLFVEVLLVKTIIASQAK